MSPRGRREPGDGLGLMPCDPGLPVTDKQTQTGRSEKEMHSAVASGSSCLQFGALTLPQALTDGHRAGALWGLCPLAFSALEAQRLSCSSSLIGSVGSHGHLWAKSLVLEECGALIGQVRVRAPPWFFAGGGFVWLTLKMNCHPWGCRKFPFSFFPPSFPLHPPSMCVCNI